MAAVPDTVPKPPRPNSIPVRPAIVAAALTITAKKIVRPELNKKDTDWQGEIWKLYDQVGELHFGLRWKAQACSRLRLVAAHSDDQPEPIVINDGADGSEPSPAADTIAVEIAESFAGGAHARSQVLRAAAVHIDAIGESYAVVYAETGEVKVFAPSDVKVQQTVWSAGGKELTDDDLIIPVRVIHPSDSTRVDSPIRAALPVLRELHGLNQQLLGAIDSRLAGAGLLVVPQAVSPPTKPSTEDDESTTPEGDAEQDPFLMALIEAMMTPIQDRESAAAVVPLVVRVPDDVVGKIQHIIFAQPFDPELRALRDEAIRRLALEMDMPPEILLGTGDVNHWGQWAIDESAIKFNIVPTAQVFVDAIVDEWYRPALEEAGILDSSAYTLLIDASELEQRVDKSAKATDLYDRAEINGDALRRETGFSSDDEPDEVERQRIVDLHAALSGKSEAVSNAEALPVTTDEPAPVDQTRALPDSPEAAPPPADAPTPAPAAALLPPEARMHSLLDAAHVSVIRALEIAGHRNVGSDRSRRTADVPLYRMHIEYPAEKDRLDFFLRDAWNALAMVAPECTVRAVDSYTRGLLSAGMEHKREDLHAALIQAGCDAS